MGDGMTESQLQAAATHAAAAAMGVWFTEKKLLRKPVGQLSLQELEGAVTAGISGWLKERARQELQKQETPTALSHGAAILS